MKKRTDSRHPLTVNILSNIRISLDGKSTLCIILAVVVVLATLAVSGLDSETLSKLIRSLFEALIGS